MFWEIIAERPDGFLLKVGDIVFRIHSGSFEKHVEEAGRSRIYNKLGHDGCRLTINETPGGNYWMPNPWIKRQQLELPVSCLAGALETIILDVEQRSPGKHHFIIGNWDLRIDTNDDPCCVYHAQWNRAR